MIFRARLAQTHAGSPQMSSGANIFRLLSGHRGGHGAASISSSMVSIAAMVITSERNSQSPTYGRHIVRNRRISAVPVGVMDPLQDLLSGLDRLLRRLKDRMTLSLP